MMTAWLHQASASRRFLYLLFRCFVVFVHEDYPPRASRRRPWRPGGRSFGPLAGSDEALASVSAGSRAPTLNSMPAAANAASAAPARGRQVVSCGLDRGFLAAGGVGWVAGQAVGAIAPSEKPIAGADAAWAMDGRGMDTTGEAAPLRCAALLWQQWRCRCRLGR